MIVSFIVIHIKLSNGSLGLAFLVDTLLYLAINFSPPGQFNRTGYYEVRVTLIPKPISDSARIESYKLLFLFEHTESFNKYQQIKLSIIKKAIIKHNKVEFFPGAQVGVISKTNAINYINKEEKSYIFLGRNRKSINKIQHPFIIKEKETFQQTEQRGGCLQSD